MKTPMELQASTQHQVCQCNHHMCLPYSLISKLSMEDDLASWCFRHSKKTPIKLVKGKQRVYQIHVACVRNLQVKNWHHVMMFMDAHAIFTQFCLKVTSHVCPSILGSPSHNNIQLSIMG